MDFGKHPLLKKVYIVMHEIEKCGASKQLTEASTAAESLAVELERFIDKDKERIIFVNRLFEICPSLKDDGLENFDGYFMTYDHFLTAFEQATGQTPDYNDDPMELLYKLVAEKEDANQSVGESAKNAIVNVRWNDGYLEAFACDEVRFGSDLLWMRLVNGSNRHIPLRQVRWFSTTPESHENIKS